MGASIIIAVILGVFRTLSNICVGAFLLELSKPLIVFAKTSSMMFDWILSTTLEINCLKAPTQRMTKCYNAIALNSKLCSQKLHGKMTEIFNNGLERMHQN